VSPCDGGLFCEFDGGTCGMFDRSGTCVRIPSCCRRIDRPACGCNGVTYSNDCVRQTAKVSKKHDGRREGADPRSEDGPTMGRCRTRSIAEQGEVGLAGAAPSAASARPWGGYNQLYYAGVPATSTRKM
jgi:hypothetical protein